MAAESVLMAQRALGRPSRLGLVAVSALSFTVAAVRVAPAQSLSAGTARQARVLDRFPQVASVEVVRGKTTRTSGSFDFYLPVDEERYLPVSPPIASELSGVPVVMPNDEVYAVSASSTCTPAVVFHSRDGKILSSEGCHLRWEVVLESEPWARTGRHELSLVFPDIREVERAIDLSRLRDPAVSPHVELLLTLWGSEEERSGAIEGPLRRRMQTAAAAESARRERLRTWFLRLAFGFALLLPVVSVLVIFWSRRWPHVKVRVASGGHVQLSEAATSRWFDARVPYGTIVETTWASDRGGRRRAIKVEYLAGVADGSGEEVRDRTPVYSFGAYRAKPHRWSGTRKLDVLVTVGERIEPGAYRAFGRHGSVSIAVS